MTALATFLKELTELRRDRAGLLVLLVMPMALVLIVSLVQDGVMQATGEAPIRVLLVDGDNSFLGRAIGERLAKSPSIELVRRGGGAAAEEEGRRAVARGDYPFGIFVAPGTGEALRAAARAEADASFSTGKERGKGGGSGGTLRGLSLRFDPAVQGALRATVAASLQRAVLGIEVEERAAALSETFSRNLRRALEERMGGLAGPGSGAEVPEVSFRPGTEPLLALSEEPASGTGPVRRATAAQQNVPAWTIFGMFFIVVPLSGALARERQTGTRRRLLTMPVSPFALLAGKVAAYVLVCMAQAALMAAAGAFVLPLLGVAPFSPGGGLGAAAVVAFAVALAATGYGMLVGTVARSHEQGSTFGAVSVVIAAALGGIMVPVYAMPRSMRGIASLSPLGWGHSAFEDIFVRGAGLGDAGGRVALLLAFFLATVTIARLSLRRGRGVQ